tara:strand:- start:187 stop:1140 length:954 start_codon:yes stop_codon:yes gene_type:complete
MKGFFVTLLILGGLAAAGYYFYEPYIKPMLGGGSRMSDGSLIEKTVTKETVSATKSNSASPVKSKATPPMVPTPKAPVPVKKSEVDLLLEKRYPMPDILPLMEIVGNWANVPERAFPPEVTASEPILFELVINGQVAGSSNMNPGTPLKPVRLIGDQIIVANLANATMSKQLHVDKTDFKQRITRRYDDFVAKKTLGVEAMRAKVKKVVEADPAKLALLKGERPPAIAASSANDPRFNPVKQSLINGDVASVKPEEVKSFAWNGTQTVGGAFPGTYETVTVNFVVETIFGRFPVEYKALLNGSKVVGWIDPFTEDRL